MKYAFIHEHRERWHVSNMCHVLHSSRSGYYAWASRSPCRREQEDNILLNRIREVHAAGRGNYGLVKTWRNLNDSGVCCGRDRVGRLRKTHGIAARRRRRFVVTTHSKPDLAIVPNRLDRQFEVATPNRYWVGDVTFIPTQSGWLYLAILLDLYSRRVVGWAMSGKNDTELTLAALQMAVERRSPGAGLMHHSDQGSTYTAGRYQDALLSQGMLPSMSRKGECHDNAVAESFFSTLKTELEVARIFRNHREARTAIFEFIEVFYNRQRIHQTLGYKSPAQFETMRSAA